jgi:hypothetical protein
MKSCDRCKNLATIRYRIQYDQTKNWALVCPDCWNQLSTNNPHYRYGGTWKSR